MILIFRVPCNIFTCATGILAIFLDWIIAKRKLLSNWVYHA